MSFSLNPLKIEEETFEATPGIEIHEDRHPQSCLASISHFVTRVQRPPSRQSPSFRTSVHGVVPNPYQMVLLSDLLRRVVRI
jgi:hypothetical protein